jgi:hypothetical protein
MFQSIQKGYTMTNPPTKIFLGELVTEPLDADAADHPVLSGTGEFRIQVSVGENFFKHSGDPFAVFKTTVAQHLASSIFDTAVPAEKWFLKPTYEMQVAFNLPEVMQMKR